MSDFVLKIRKVSFSFSPCEQAVFNCSEWPAPGNQTDRDRGRVTERMTLMDKRKGERGKESDGDRVKDSIREFNGEEEDGVPSLTIDMRQR